MDKEQELRERTVWQKYLSYEKTEKIFGETWYAGVFCVREVSGYAVWYKRWLKDAGNESVSVSNGNYLLRFYSSDARHDAIEFSVLSAVSQTVDSNTIIVDLDNATKRALLCFGKSDAPRPMVEQVD